MLKRSSTAVTISPATIRTPVDIPKTMVSPFLRGSAADPLVAGVGQRDVVVPGTDVGDSALVPHHDYLGALRDGVTLGASGARRPAGPLLRVDQLARAPGADRTREPAVYADHLVVRRIEVLFR